MLLISLTFFIAATKNRLWHSNPTIEKTHKYLLAQMLGPLMNIATFYLLSKPLEKIYVVWGAILMIAQGTLFCIAEACTLNDSNSVKLLFIGMLTYNLVDVTSDIPQINGRTSRGFVINLWVIWGLIILKAAERFFSFEAAKRTYGADSIYSVSNYLRYQDDQPPMMSDAADTVYKQGHKYIVSGEDRILFRMELKEENKMQMVPYNKVSIDNKVITLDKLWDCQGDLLRHQMDLDGRFKDICLSFALMKLLRRRFLDNPNEELIKESKASILQDLMIKSKDDKSRVFRVIKTELGFLEDFFFSKYPIVFGYGLPICNYLLSLLLMAATGWIIVSTASLCQKNSDFYITYVLVAMILIMEITEITTYVLSDWTKVSLLIIYVQFPWLQQSYLVNTALKFFFRTKILQPVREKVGQFSLLRHYQHFPIQARPCRPTHAPIKVPEAVKATIVDCLRLSKVESQTVQVSNGEKSLERNGKKKELGWACELPTSTHTILVWHIATCYCETKKTSQTREPSSPTSTYKEVATTLSNYCAHLVVYAPDLLPDRGNEAKLIFDEMITETDAVLKGAEDENEMWKKMIWKGADEESNSKTAARKGAELGKQLVDEIKKEEEIWKVLSEFWAEYILYLASSNNVQAHKEHLASGGEFITHLWVLLYHVGILERPEKAPNTEQPADQKAPNTQPPDQKAPNIEQPEKDPNTDQGPEKDPNQYTEQPET
ncbi:hypothetical protein ZIOFF_000039 [Zingiber officinale]|uniref:DUF4220 domain-containing protein n=2 Tax=Zingiber officinale TaxID=94328 RepID=A0A8J5IHA5_ZINOF|nr:hypothetical protein ZIOFF_000039 [Zingiber officinale]